MPAIELKEIQDFNDYLKNDTLYRTTYMGLLHYAFPLMDNDTKEEVYTDTMMRFPETVAYAMLKLSTDKTDVKDRYWDEYKESYKSYLDDIESDLYMAFDDLDIFLTYVRLNVLNMAEYTDKLGKHIENVLRGRHLEKEKDEWINKKIF